MKINKKLITTLIAISLSSNSFAFDISQFFSQLFSSRAGGKAADYGEEKDIEKFKKFNKCQNHYPWGEAKIKDPEVLKRVLYICRGSYSIQYDPLTKLPLSVSEVLTKPNVLYSKYPKAENFQIDPDLTVKMQSSLTDYKANTYEKGNMAAPINMSIYDEGLSDEQLVEVNSRVMNESFYLSNVAPMVAGNLKTTIWAELEAQIRYWGSQKDRLLVTTGPIFLGGQVKGFLGENKTAIPTHFYKIVTDPLTYGSVSYIIPNQEIVTSKTKAIKNPKDAYYCNNEKKLCELNDFIVSIKEIEKLTSLEFYPILAPYYAVQVKQDVSEIYKYKKKN